MKPSLGVRVSLFINEHPYRFRSPPSSPRTPTAVKRRPTSVVGYKRPISQYAQMAVATATGAPSRYQVSLHLPLLFPVEEIKPSASEERSQGCLVPDALIFRCKSDMARKDFLFNYFK